MASDGPGSVTVAYRWLAGRLGLFPVQVVLRDLERRHVDIGRLRALDLFGGTGDRVTRHYADLVRSLDVWEIDPRNEPALRRNLPRARIAIVDSFAELGRTDRVYDLVVADNPIWPIEHFPIFPDVFRVLSDDAVLMLIVIVDDDRRTRRRYRELMDEDHLRQRREFYATDSPEPIPVEEMVARYRALGEQNGLSLWWHRVVGRREIDRLLPRRVGISLLALGLRRT